ncbi:MAG TPA: N-acetyltransferase [Myxococcaceae bacterium]|nr:N-acetyltransferase [Myxococcaceae bacterium]
MSVAQALLPELPAVPADLTLVPVSTAADRDAFVKFPYALYKDDPNWVPPLLLERKDFINPRKNPWFEFGTVQLYLARRGGKVIGRIAAVDDPHYNAFHGTQLGFFGMFECIDDPGVARALFDAAALWCKARGFREFIGPVNFSTNYECSVLVDGFDSPPVLLMAYNPSYYPGLYEACGFAKAHDLWAWEIDTSKPPPEKVRRVAEKVRQREGLVIRAARMEDFDNEARRIKALYNEAWEKNWGFVPMTEREFDQVARDMKPMIRPELVLIAEVQGEPVAFAMTVPNANEAIRAANGRLFRYGLPIGLVKLALAQRKIQRVRLVILGVKQKYRKRGIDAVLYLDTLLTSAKLGYPLGEISWTLESNDMVNRSIELMGGRKYKTYRIYQRAT